MSMALIAEHLLITALSLLFFPAVGLLVLTIVLASMGKSLGIRQIYVALLLKIFEVSGSSRRHVKKIFGDTDCPCNIFLSSSTCVLDIQ